jgi:hypothetical protein
MVGQRLSPTPAWRGRNAGMHSHVTARTGSTWTTICREDKEYRRMTVKSKQASKDRLFLYSVHAVSTLTIPAPFHTSRKRTRTPSSYGV